MSDEVYLKQDVDGSGQTYLEIDSLRITEIEGGEQFRIQIKDDTGHLRQGPQVSRVAFRLLCHLGEGFLR